MTVPAVVGRLEQMSATLSTLGSQLAGVAPTGGFAAVLAQVSSGFDDAAPPSEAAPPELPSEQPAGEASAPVSTEPFVTAAAMPTGASPVVGDAVRYLGVPYQWGGTDPSTGLDCSGFVQRVYGDLGVQLPRTSQEQVNVGTPVDSLADAQPGDLLFFEPGPDGPGHVGIYVGNGEMIDAPHTGTKVRFDPAGQPVAIRRVLPAGGATAVLTSSPTASGAGMAALGVPAALEPDFVAAGQRYGVDPLLLAAVAKQESGFDPSAVSPAGAQGIMQLMPATAAGLGVSTSDPASSIDGAAQLLSGYLGQYGGSVPLALAAYNAGPAAVAQYGGVPPYGETQNYVSSITGMLQEASA